ncbi:MAG: O-antigen ligase family protein, partial [Terriglobales bacterium]
SGAFYDANMYGVLCAWALLWLLDRGSRARTTSARAGHLALIAATAVNLAAADSRAGYAALAAGAAVLLLLGRGRTVTRVALLALLVVIVFPQRSWDRVQASVATLEQALLQSTSAFSAVPVRAADVPTAERLASMRQALRQIASHPLLGLGFGRSLYLGVPTLDSGAVRPPGQGAFQGAQDMGLTVLAETGPIGLALFLLALAAPVRELLRRARQAPAAAAMLAGFVGLLTACFTIEALWNARVLALVVVLTAGSVAIRRSPCVLLEAAP